MKISVPCGESPQRRQVPKTLLALEGHNQGIRVHLARNSVESHPFGRVIYFEFVRLSLKSYGGVRNCILMLIRLFPLKVYLELTGRLRKEAVKVGNIEPVEDVASRRHTNGVDIGFWSERALAHLEALHRIHNPDMA